MKGSAKMKKGAKVAIGVSVGVVGVLALAVGTVYGVWSKEINSVLSILSYLLKAPEVPRGTPVVNALSKQRECIINIFRACIGLQPDNHMMLEYKKQQH